MCVLEISQIVDTDQWKLHLTLNITDHVVGAYKTDKKEICNLQSQYF